VRMTGTLPSQLINGYDATEVALFRVVRTSLFGDPTTSEGDDLDSIAIILYFLVRIPRNAEEGILGPCGVLTNWPRNMIHLSIAMLQTEKDYTLGPRLNPTCIIRPGRELFSRNVRNEHAVGVYDAGLRCCSTHRRDSAADSLYLSGCAIRLCN
ncbi:MAG TPA: hypothetical protein VN849_06180, partial [Stellaceae bacterium]|nr:hypothetical protein [Stellaceae bacterium]